MTSRDLVSAAGKMPHFNDIMSDPRKSYVLSACEKYEVTERETVQNAAIPVRFDTATSGKSIGVTDIEFFYFLISRRLVCL